MKATVVLYFLRGQVGIILDGETDRPHAWDSVASAREWVKETPAVVLQAAEYIVIVDCYTGQMSVAGRLNQRKEPPMTK